MRSCTRAAPIAGERRGRPDAATFARRVRSVRTNRDRARGTAADGDALSSVAATPGSGWPRLLVAAAAGVVVVGIVLRFAVASPLWLDEALTVNIATLSLDELPEALRRDGAPPLYYLLLHAWTRLFGTGDLAVRSMSGVAAVAALPLAWTAGRQIDGRDVAGATVILLATSPFAIRYATEARMYSLVILGVLGGYVLVRKALVEPRWPLLVGIATVAGLLALTHYWSLYLLAVVGAALILRWRRWGDHAAGSVTAAIAAGGIFFVPWLPSFLYQIQNTGTPWGRPAGPIDAAITTLTDFGGGRAAEARTLAVLLGVLAVLALTALPIGRLRLELDLRTRPGVRAEAAVGAATLAIAVLAGWASGNAFATRYTAVVVPLVLLTAAWGSRQLGDRRLIAAVLAVAAALGLAGGARNAVTDRTQAAEIATYVNRQGETGDLVVYCPDQLGPAVHRLLGEGFHELTFPTGEPPLQVDWVGYRERNRAADPGAFARRVLEQAPADAVVWLVWMPGYRTFGEKCEDLSVALGNARPRSEIVILHDEALFERHNLTRLPPP